MKTLVFGLCVATNAIAYELTSLFSTTRRTGRINSFSVWGFRAKWLDNCWWLLLSVSLCFVLVVLKGKETDAILTLVDVDGDEEISLAMALRWIYWELVFFNMHTSSHTATLLKPIHTHLPFSISAFIDRSIDLRLKSNLSKNIYGQRNHIGPWDWQLGMDWLLCPHWLGRHEPGFDQASVSCPRIHWLKVSGIKTVNFWRAADCSTFWITTTPHYNCHNIMRHALQEYSNI